MGDSDKCCDKKDKYGRDQKRGVGDQRREGFTEKVVSERRLEESKKT